MKLVTALVIFAVIFVAGVERANADYSSLETNKSHLKILQKGLAGLIANGGSEKRIHRIEVAIRQTQESISFEESQEPRVKAATEFQVQNQKSTPRNSTRPKREAPSATGGVQTFIYPEPHPKKSAQKNSGSEPNSSKVETPPLVVDPEVREKREGAPIKLDLSFRGAKRYIGRTVHLIEGDQVIEDTVTASFDGDFIITANSDQIWFAESYRFPLEDDHLRGKSLTITSPTDTSRKKVVQVLYSYSDGSILGTDGVFYPTGLSQECPSVMESLDSATWINR